MMKQYLIILVACMLSLQSVAQQYGSFKDPRDGKVYKTVKIGSLVWLAQNLNVDRFRNGEIIQEAKSINEWKEFVKNKQAAYCYFFHNSTDYGLKYGKIYNWYAIKDIRGLSPLGWHIPTKQEFTELISFYPIHLKSTIGWKVYTVPIAIENSQGILMGWRDREMSGNGDNRTGFSALPGGYVDEDGKMEGFWSSKSGWWSSTEVDPKNSVILFLSSDNSNSNISGGGEIDEGYYVRCVKDGSIDWANKLVKDSIENVMKAREAELKIKLMWEKDSIESSKLIQEKEKLAGIKFKNDSIEFAKNEEQRINKMNEYENYFKELRDKINTNFLEAKDLLISRFIFPQMTWEEAEFFCKKIGDGWRLPNEKDYWEFKILYNKWGKLNPIETDLEYIEFSNSTPSKKRNVFVSSYWGKNSYGCEVIPFGHYSKFFIDGKKASNQCAKEVKNASANDIGLDYHESFKPTRERIDRYAVILVKTKK